MCSVSGSGCFKTGFPVFLKLIWNRGKVCAWDFCFDFVFVCCLFNLRNHVCDLAILLRNVIMVMELSFFLFKKKTLASE